MDNRICKLSDCDALITRSAGLGFCRPHYRTFKKHGDPRLTFGKRSCLACSEEFAPTHGSSKWCAECTPVQRALTMKTYSDQHREASIAYNRQWRLDNPGYHKAYNDQYRVTHPDYAKTYSREYRLKNLEVVRERFKRWEAAHPNHNSDWARNNPERARASVRRRRALRKQARTFMVSQRDYRRGLMRANNACAYCRVQFDGSVVVHWDHVVPLVAGGSHGIGNLVPTCATCNVSKGTNFLTEWRYRELLSAPPTKRLYASVA